MNKFKCEICNNREFYEFTYPVSVNALKRKIFLGALRRYFVNFSKFIFRLAIKLLPRTTLMELKKRIFSPYKRLQSFNEVFSTFKKIDRAVGLFKDKQILICKKCDLGTVFPRINEKQLVDFYSKDYWIANLGELEPAESNRTIVTYKLLVENIDFNSIKSVIEFGSASAHLSRYFKSKEPRILFDAIDPGILWGEILKKELRDVYNNLDQITSKYDLLVSSHSLEHVSSLDSYFIKFNNLLNDGGYLYFEVPNSEEKEIIFGKKPDFHLSHTYFFTPKSFVGIANKFGFEIIFSKTFSRSYGERSLSKGKSISSMKENPKGAYIRVLLKKQN